MLRNYLVNILGILVRIFRKNSITVFKSNIDYWVDRSKRLGDLSVLDSRHSIDDIDGVTENQKSHIFPYLKKTLEGDERTLLDFGCGTGRFSESLAELIQGKVIGVDPVKNFINSNKKNTDVEYRHLADTKINAVDNEFDVVWSCLVLGGIKTVDLNKSIEELQRVSAQNALFCIVENTSNKPNGKYWYFRSVEEYKELFSFVELVHVGDYKDLDDKISILIGRTKPSK